MNCELDQPRAATMRAPMARAEPDGNDRAYERAARACSAFLAAASRAASRAAARRAASRAARTAFARASAAARCPARCRATLSVTARACIARSTMRSCADVSPRSATLSSALVAGCASPAALAVADAPTASDVAAIAAAAKPTPRTETRFIEHVLPVLRVARIRTTRSCPSYVAASYPEFPMGIEEGGCRRGRCATARGGPDRGHTGGLTVFHHDPGAFGRQAGAACDGSHAVQEPRRVRER